MNTEHGNLDVGLWADETGRRKKRWKPSLVRQDTSSRNTPSQTISDAANNGIFILAALGFRPLPK
jgi:hypothetical protein